MTADDQAGLSTDRGAASPIALIDKLVVDVRPGDTILAAAHRAGIDVPTLCFAHGLPPEGGCRMCLVEIEGADRPRGACHTPLEPGMRVRTATARLQALRRDILGLAVSELGEGRFGARDGPHPPAPSPKTAGRGGGAWASGVSTESRSEFEALLEQFGVGESPYGRRGDPAVIDSSHPYLRFDPTLCITCRRCLHACEGVQGQFVYGIAGRGAEVRLIFGPGDRFAESGCVACGACVNLCPTGAITDRDRMHSIASGAASEPAIAESPPPPKRLGEEGGPGPGPAPAQTTDSVCGYCGVGCRVRIETAAGRVQRIGGVPDAATNRGHLCVKGRYAHGWQGHPDRLTRPLLRGPDGFRPVDWGAALDWLARRLVEIRDRHGPDALGALTSSRSTNEAAYLLQKLFRTAIGTNNVDCCARVCHASTALALQAVTGTGAASASYADIEAARCIVVAGANPTEAHPVVGARIKRAALGGAPLVVIDPRRIELADYAELHLAPKPGTNVALFNAMAKALMDAGLIDRDYIAERVEGLGVFADFVERVSLDEAAAITGVDADLIRRAAERIGRSGGALFVSGLGLSELTQGVASVMTLANLAMLTGGIGQPGAGMLPLRGQNNVQGNADMGGMPTQVTGYQGLADPAVRARLAAIWGKAPPERPGLTVTEMTEASVDGRLRALWIQGEDIAQSDPYQSRVIAGLAALDLLVVQELFMTPTAELAHLVLPAAGVLEQEGTFTNGERRIQQVRPALPPPGEARPDWAVIAELGRRLGEPWGYGGPAEVMDEIAHVAPALFGGVRYDRLAPDGLQWPCPSLDHPGTATVHADGFLRGKGQLVAIDQAPNPEHGVAGFDWLLITGRVLDHYNVGSQTRRTPSRALTPADLLEIHPDDAARLGVGAGDLVAIESRWGETRAQAHPTARVSPGTLFLSFHFPETHANRLVGPHVDPQSKCPQYKATAVRVRPVG